MATTRITFSSASTHSSTCCCIDRLPPQTRLVCPELIHVVESVQKRDLADVHALPQFRILDGHPCRDSKEPFYAHPDANKFFLVQLAIAEHFDDVVDRVDQTETDKNNFTLVLLETLDKLTEFGFYSTLQVRLLTDRSP